MMSRITKLVALAALYMPDVAAAADATWHVSEGADGARRGVWYIRVEGSRVAGSGTMENRDHSASFRISGSYTGREYVLQRSGATDGSHCAYRGKFDPQTARITGVVLCGRISAAWTAVPQGKD